SDGKEEKKAMILSRKSVKVVLWKRRGIGSARRANGDESGRMAAGQVQGSASRVLACGVRRAPVAYCRGLSARGTGEILYVRGLINAMLGVEAIRTAQEKFGKKPLTGEQVRWGLENLNLPAERLSNLDSRTSCNRSRCHAPTTRARGRGVSRPGTAKNGTSCRVGSRPTIPLSRPWSRRPRQSTRQRRRSRPVA